MGIRQKPLKTLVSIAVVSIITTSAAYSTGFSLYTETSPAGIGNYMAGSAAEAADASIGWNNPAGLVLIRETQAVSGGTGIFPISSLTGSSTFRSTPPTPNYVQTFSNLETGTNAFVPAFHAAMPIGDRATVGLSMISPFGLATDWDSDSPVRYDSTFSELITLNVAPELGGLITDNFAVGGGIDFQFARVKFNSMLGAPTFFQAVPGQALGGPTRADTESYNKGKSYGIGFHAGVMGLFNQNHTRVGLNYQSKMKHTFYGFSNLRGFLATNVDLVPPPAYVNAGQFTSDGLFSNEITLPDVVTLSAYHDLNQKFALLGSVVYTNWSVFKQIELNKVAAPSINPNLTISQVYVNSRIPQNFRNSWRASLGMNYRINNQWMLRAGTGYDQTPTNDVDRSVRLPDADRYALSIGGHYQMRPNIGIDLGYTHLFGKDGTINSTRVLGSSTFNVNADVKAHADLLGGQVVYAMDSIPVPTK